MTGSLVEVGRVAGPHGLAGKIRVKTYAGDPSGPLHARTVRLSAEGPGGERRVRDFEVRAAQPQGGFAVFSLDGIDTPDAAREWSGASVSVFREELPPPAEDEYYWVDLVGCEVADGEGRPLGVVAGVTEGTAYDWLVVRRGDGEALLPMVEAFIRRVDLAGRRITASPPEGW